MSIDKALKDYKARVKENKTSLESLEQRARDISDAQVQSEETQTSLEQVQSELGNVTTDKIALKEQVSEARILDDPALPELTEQYKGLAARVEELQSEADGLREVIEDRTPNAEEVASLKAELHTLAKGTDGSLLLKAVNDAITEDTGALSQATQACERTLPSVDTLTLARALPGLEVRYEQWRQYIEDEIELGRGEQARKVVDYQMDRLLAR